jgi:hypothetical protein
MAGDTYQVFRDSGGKVMGGIELVESPDDDGWYAQEFDFTRRDNATRTSQRIYRTRSNLVHSLRDGRHRWQAWS